MFLDVYAVYDIVYSVYDIDCGVGPSPPLLKRSFDCHKEFVLNDFPGQIKFN